MSNENTFPLGQYSRQDVEDVLNDKNFSTRQDISALTDPFTRTRHHYGWGYKLGDGANWFEDQYVEFVQPIPNPLQLNISLAGASTAIPTEFPTYTNVAGGWANYAGLTENGFSARIINNNTNAFSNGTAYIYTWHLISQVI